MTDKEKLQFALRFGNDARFNKPGTCYQTLGYWLLNSDVDFSLLTLVERWSKAELLDTAGEIVLTHNLPKKYSIARSQSGTSIGYVSDLTQLRDALNEMNKEGKSLSCYKVELT